MAAAAQDVKAIGAEETKAGNHDLVKDDLLANEEKKPQNIGPTNKEISSVGKESELKDTKPDKNDIEESVEAGFEIIATDQVKQEPKVTNDSIEPIGKIKEIKENAVPTEIKASNNENKDEETQEQKVTGDGVMEVKDIGTTKDKAQHTSNKDSTITKEDEIKKELQTAESSVEAIGTITDTESNKEKLVPSETHTFEDEKVSESVRETDTTKKENEKESHEASVIDIKIIKESADNSNKESPESESHSSEELEAALTAIPELSSSDSKEILADANTEGDVKKIVAEIEEKTEDRPEGTLIDITVIEETDKEKNVQEVVKEAENSFEAEVIEDNADIEVVPSEGEEVIEYTLEARDALPVITVLVALVAIFVALIFYYN